MKIARWLMVVAFVSLAASVAKADGIDPAIGVQGDCQPSEDGCRSLWTGSVKLTITSSGFVTSDSFFIETGTIFNFDLTFDTPQAAAEGQPIFTTLAGSAFQATTVSSTEALLSGGTIFPCSGDVQCVQTGNQIFGDFHFAFDGVTLGNIRQPDGTVTPGTTVTITSNVPEPGTITLMLAGLAALGLLLFLGGKSQANLAGQIP